MENARIIVASVCNSLKTLSRSPL